LAAGRGVGPVRRSASRLGVLICLAALLGPAGALGGASVLGAAEKAGGKGLDQAERALQETRDAIARQRSTSVELGEQAASHRAALERLRNEATTLAAETQSMERMVNQLETHLAALFADELRFAAALAERARPRSEALSAMVRLSRTPPRALMLSPDSVVDSSRTILLLGALSDSLEAEAAVLNGRLAELAAVRSDIAGERRRLDEAKQGLAQRRAALDALMTEKADLERAAESSRNASEERLAGLVREAKDLEDLVVKLEAAQTEADAAAASDTASTLTPQVMSGTDARRVALDQAAQLASAEPREGAFAMPAEGRIVARFGASTAPGVTAKGISIETRADAPVVAPFAGKIVFAGPFHHYGQLLIIAHGQGYHTLLAGLGRIDSTVGHWVLEGEPVGTMGTLSASRPQLYLELRFKGRPVNPVPWLATGSNKLSG